MLSNKDKPREKKVHIPPQKHKRVEGRRTRKIGRNKKIQSAQGHRWKEDTESIRSYMGYTDRENKRAWNVHRISEHKGVKVT